MITVVQKPFEGEGRQLESGEVVDSSSWRNEGRLINTRHLRPATESEVEDFNVKPPAKKRKAKTAKAKTAKVAKAKTAKKKTAKKIAAPAKTRAPRTTPPPAAPAAGTAVHDI